MSLLQKLNLKRETLIGFFGSMAEAYNMAAFLFIAPVLASQLFSESDSLQAIIYTYGLTFTGYFLAYPLGALYYGSIGDKLGRKLACTSSSLGLALATGCMGLVPISGFESYAWIGFLVLNCMQSFFSGGEYHSSVIFSLEHGDHKESGKLSGLACLFAVLGIISAKILSIVALNEIVSWRIIFLVGFLGGALSYGFKFICTETPDFIEAAKIEKPSGNYFEFFSNHGYKLVKAVSVTGFFTVIYSYIYVFLPIVLPGGLASSAGSTIWGLAIYGVVLAFSGLLADKLGTRTLMMIGAGGIAIGIIPLSMMLLTNEFLVIMILTLLACAFIGPIHSWLMNQFNPHERCRSIMIASATTSALFSGTAVPICLFIYQATGSLTSPAIYPAIMGLAALWFLGSSKKAKN